MFVILLILLLFAIMALRFPQIRIWLIAGLVIIATGVLIVSKLDSQLNLERMAVSPDGRKASGLSLSAP